MGFLQGATAPKLAVVGGTEAPPRDEAGMQPAVGEPGAVNSATIGANSLLASTIRTDWSRNKRARDRMEYRLLACLYARRAEYQLDELNGHWTDGAGAGLYLGEISSKMRTCDAMMRDIVLPEGDKPWSYEAPPCPDLPPAWMKVAEDKATQRAQAKLVQMKQQQGAMMDFNAYKAVKADLLLTAKDEARKEMKRKSDERTARMEQNVETLLELGGYTDAMAEFIHHFGTFPTAVLAGPFPTKKRVGKWTDDGRFEVSEKVIPFAYAAHPLDCYPAPEAKSAQKGCFIERLRWSRGDLYDCIGVRGYFEDAIRRVLEFHESGALRGWLWSDMERRQLEGMTWDTWQPDYLVDGLRYWNAVEGRQLQELGVDIGDGDPLAYYEVHAVLIGNEVVYCTLNDHPLRERPYQEASFDKVPGAFWGNGIYDIGRDCGAMINGAVRAIDANMGLASGPIIGVDVSQLAEDEDPKAIAPLQTIQLDRSRSTGANMDPLVFFQAESRAAEHLSIIAAFKHELDDLTGIPRIQVPAPGTQGDGTATQRRIELAMQSKNVRQAAYNIDQGVVRPYMNKMFFWEMTYGEDQAAKGPANVVARGTMAQLIKEHMQEQQRALTKDVATTPALASLVGETGLAEMLRGTVDSVGFDVDKVVPDEQTLRQRQQQRVQTPPQPSPDAVLKSQTDLKKAGLNAQVKLLTESEIHPREAAQLGPAIEAVAGQTGADKLSAGPQQGGALGG